MTEIDQVDNERTPSQLVWRPLQNLDTAQDPHEQHGQIEEHNGLQDKREGVADAVLPARTTQANALVLVSQTPVYVGGGAPA
eukprot:CAMPEP_0115131142 /NCGR_PEP_ID=MMETSP0227-20121206/52917_1 /TAXON_ID=89957 /ORGANISM="Polarella glacialis, Strain CCMP 1383" /LENGTH=81 /DNA_ID=CAMNT_0002536559 /DNA_START=286 /DNA_END=531 /DNA_ORIENTATION=+